MKFLPNYQNRIKRKPCEHVFSVLDEKIGLKRCLRCFMISEEGMYGY